MKRDELTMDAGFTVHDERFGPFARVLVYRFNTADNSPHPLTPWVVWNVAPDGGRLRAATSANTGRRSGTSSRATPGLRGVVSGLQALEPFTGATNDAVVAITQGGEASPRPR